MGGARMLQQEKLTSHSPSSHAYGGREAYQQVLELAMMARILQ
jgi:hypothetical protein